jgi:hypothetical protein
MSRKTSAARREAFFRALAATGNQTIAAERAKVSRSWVTLHRAGDPAFRARMEAAVAEAKARFDRLDAEGGDMAPASGWGSLDGEELVVRGTNGRRTQIARARVKQWSPRVEDRFLAVLAATCNVKAACAEVGLSAASAYNHRHRWVRFAERWDAAVETGYVRIQLALLESSGTMFGNRELPPEVPIPPMTAEQAIHLLHMHKNQVHGMGKRPGKHWRRPRTLDEVRDSILRKLAAIETARREAEAPTVSAGTRAADREEWARRRPRNPE